MGGKFVKILHIRKQLSALFLPGFLIGIIYANIVVKKYLASPDIFSDYFFRQYTSAQIVVWEYFIYLARVRILPFLLVTGLAFTKIRKISSAAAVLWAGFSAGMLLTLASVSIGIKGILLCIVGIFPQFLFYVPAYVVVLFHGMAYPRSRWNSQKTVFIVGMLVIGILMEMYVNPVLMKAFVRIL